MSHPVVTVNRSKIEQRGQFHVHGEYKRPGRPGYVKDWIVIGLAVVDGRARYLCVESDQDISNPFLSYAGGFSMIEGATVCTELPNPIPFDADGWYFFPRRSDQYRTVEYVPEEARTEAVYGHGAIPLSDILTDSVEVTRIQPV